MGEFMIEWVVWIAILLVVWIMVYLLVRLFRFFESRLESQNGGLLKNGHCSTCKWYQYPGYHRGDCLRNAPIASKAELMNTPIWPSVESNHFCGEYEFRGDHGS